MNQPLILNIQKYSIHDGEGIRTTVFFKGCPLRCIWCHNPESQDFGPELLYDASKCVGCGACAAVCPNQANQIFERAAVLDRSKCSSCGKCVEVCLGQARELSGRAYSIEELIQELEKDRAFYEESGGGITLSGGEVLAQPMDYIQPLVMKLFEKGYSVFIDTCGDVPYERFEKILPYTDTFLYDIKTMSDQKHRDYTGTGNERILENLRKLSEDGARIVLRLPLMDGLNTESEDLFPLLNLLKSGVRVAKINLLPYHHTGKSKYDRLDRPYDRMKILEIPAREKLEQIADFFRINGFANIEIGG